MSCANSGVAVATFTSRSVSEHDYKTLGNTVRCLRHRYPAPLGGPVNSALPRCELK